MSDPGSRATPRAQELTTFGTLNHPPFGNYKSAEECADRAKHTPDPPGYLAWMEWAEKKAKTHDQHQCPTCGFWVIWKPKRKAATG